MEIHKSRTKNILIVVQSLKINYEPTESLSSGRKIEFSTEISHAMTKIEWNIECSERDKTKNASQEGKTKLSYSLNFRRNESFL